MTMFEMPPEMWRNLLARAVIFRATRRTIGRLCELADQEPAVGRLLLDLELSAAAVSRLDGDAAAVVGRMVESWCAVLTAAVESHLVAPVARELFEDMLTSLRAGVAGDDPFTAMLRNVERHAQALYGDAWRPTVLSVFHRRSHPRLANVTTDPYAVTATIVWPPSADRADVELHVYCEKFGPEAYAAVPMLLTHECVCHVAARQEEARADSVFAEGLLDWAAYYFLDIWAIKLDPEFGPAVRKHAQELKKVLMGDKQTTEGRARRVGPDEASYLQAWFEQFLTLSAEESRVRVAQLAVELNTVDRPLAAKDNLVSRLAWPLPPDLDEALRSWADGEMPTEKLLDLAVCGQS
jgi:hypothetical protein